MHLKTLLKEGSEEVEEAPGEVVVFKLRLHWEEQTVSYDQDSNSCDDEDGYQNCNPDLERRRKSFRKLKLIDLVPLKAQNWVRYEESTQNATKSSYGLHRFAGVHKCLRNSTHKCSRNTCRSNHWASW